MTPSCKCVSCAGRTARCFWCNKPSKRLTLDHVRPKVAGGDLLHNTVAACDACQRARNVAQDFMGKIAQLADLIGRKWHWGSGADRDRIRRAHRRPIEGAYEARRTAAAWALLERIRWGSAPSLDLNLTVPDLPPEQEPAT